MNTGLVIKGGDIDKDVIVANKDAIIAVLGAALEHRSDAVTLAALETLRDSIDTSINGVSVSNCSIGDTYEEDDRDKDEAQAMNDLQPE